MCSAVDAFKVLFPMTHVYQTWLTLVDINAFIDREVLTKGGWYHVDGYSPSCLRLAWLHCFFAL